MDPEANLRELICNLEYSNDPDADRAMELVSALTHWLAGGGLAPKWRVAHEACKLAIHNMEARAELAAAAREVRQ